MNAEFFSTELSGIEGPGGKDFFHMPKDGWFREDQVSEGAWDLVFNKKNLGHDWNYRQYENIAIKNMTG